MIPEPDRATTKPCPPLRTRLLKTAIVMSARPTRTGSASGPAMAAVSPRSPSRNRRWRGVARSCPASSMRTASAPDSIAAALPRLRACRITAAPAPCASAAVPSADPSSTTMTMSTPGSPAAPFTVAAIRSASFLAGMMTARSPPRGSMGAILCRRGGLMPLATARRWLPLASGRLRLAYNRRGVVEHGEDRLQARHLQNLLNRRARRGQFEVAALLSRPPVRGQQHVHPGRIAELDAGHVDHDLLRPASSQGRDQFAVQPRRGIQIDLAAHRHDGATTLRPNRHLKLHVPHLTG